MKNVFLKYLENQIKYFNKSILIYINKIIRLLVSEYVANYGGRHRRIPTLYARGSP